MKVPYPVTGSGDGTLVPWGLVGQTWGARVPPSSALPSLIMVLLADPTVGHRVSAALPELFYTPSSAGTAGTTPRPSTLPCLLLCSGCFDLFSAASWGLQSLGVDRVICMQPFGVGPVGTSPKHPLWREMSLGPHPARLAGAQRRKTWSPSLSFPDLGH